MNSKRSDLEIDFETLQIRRDEKHIRLTPTEWKLLQALIEHKNQALSHKFLLKMVWGDVYGKESSYLYAYMRRLREKLEMQEGDSQQIITLPKLGYQWIEQETDVSLAHSPLTGKHDAYNTLPAPLTSFIGRERELRLLEGMLRKRDIRLTTLTGPGGIGKTRLALETARALASDSFFNDGIYFVGLETVDTADYVVSAIAHVFGIREKAGEALLISLKSHLRDKQLLLILDNFEHVHAAATEVLDILKAASGLKVLVTSREHLNLYGEHHFEVPSLSPAGRLHSVADMNTIPNDAVQLFVDRAKAANPYFEVTADNAAVLLQLCERLDGLPLAIELAAVQSKRFSPEELLKRLDSRLSSLVGGHWDLPPRHQTLQAAIDWSYQLLDANDRHLFICLSIFNGSFTRDAVEALYTSDALRQTRIAQKLLSLQNQSLLTAQWDDERGEARYMMLGAFREYANQRLGRSEAAELGHRHADYYVQLLEQSVFAAAENSHERLSLDLGNFRAALNSALANGDGELALRLGVGLHELWLRLGILREGKQRLLDILNATANHESALRARALYCTGVISDWLGEPIPAQGLYRESLRLYEQLQDATGIASTLLTLASALINQGDYGEGRALSDQALAMARLSNDLPGAALALNNLGMVAIYQGEALEAQRIYEETRALWHSLNSAQGMGWSFTGLSWTALLQGDYEGAQDFVNQSLALHQQSGDMLSMALALTCDSWIALYQADFTASTTKLTDCLSLCHELGLLNLSVWPLVGLGLIDLHRGDVGQAEQFFDEALDICKQLNFPPMTTWVYIALGRLFRIKGMGETAFDYLDRALMLSHTRDDKSALITTLEEFAAYFAAQKQFEVAAQLSGAADSMRERYGLPLPKIDRMQHDSVKTRSSSRKGFDWYDRWHAGRSLPWSEITGLIYPAGSRWREVPEDERPA